MKYLLMSLLLLPSLWASATFPTAKTIEQVLALPAKERKIVEEAIVSTLIVSLNSTGEACFYGRQDKAHKVVRDAVMYLASKRKYKEALKVDYAYFAHHALVQRMPCYDSAKSLYN